mmetsp:Transcript_29993/g.40598  ORF Transcript_29993/g.40598 Transcript_29993/m.40598 type:complete len:239 (+) Transcript_29993:338-1054(+)
MASMAAFCASTFGIVSSASANSAIAHCSYPSNVLAKSSKWRLSAVSTAPPPGTTALDSRVRETAQRESCTERSVSCSMYSFAPRRRIVAAFEALQPLMKMKSLSPTRCSTTSSAWPRQLASKPSSPSMLAMVKRTCPPVHFAMRLMSCLLTRRTAMMPASMRYFCAKSSMPLVVNSTLVPASTIVLIFSFVMSISFWRTRSSSSGSSMTMFTLIDMRCFFRSKSISAIFAGVTCVGIS